MRKIVFALLMLLSLSLSAQNEGVMKFLGIPIDGTKEEMISKIKEKGFTYDALNDCLEGEFNGSDVNIFIGTNKGNVYRVFVADSKTISEAQIKIRYNNLVYQFEHNSKYRSAETDQYIDDDEDISYQMSVKNKYYDAVFFQKDDERLDAIISFIEDAQFETMFETIHNMAKSACDLMEENYFEEHYLVELKDMSKEEVFEYDKNFVKAVAVMSEASLEMQRKVWFRIFEHYGEYYIGIYYDNMNNAAKGEDL